MCRTASGPFFLTAGFFFLIPLVYFLSIIEWQFKGTAIQIYDFFFHMRRVRTLVDIEVARSVLRLTNTS